MSLPLIHDAHLPSTGPLRIRTHVSNTVKSARDNITSQLNRDGTTKPTVQQRLKDEPHAPRSGIRPPYTGTKRQRQRSNSSCSSEQDAEIVVHRGKKHCPVSDKDHRPTSAICSADGVTSGSHDKVSTQQLCSTWVRTMCFAARIDAAVPIQSASGVVYAYACFSDYVSIINDDYHKIKRTGVLADVYYPDPKNPRQPCTMDNMAMNVKMRKDVKDEPLYVLRAVKHPQLQRPRRVAIRNFVDIADVQSAQCAARVIVKKLPPVLVMLVLSYIVPRGASNRTRQKCLQQ